MALAPNDMGATENGNVIRLVTAHRSGDASAFSEIVRTHYATLLACARRRLTSPQDAEDAVQEAFLRAYRRLETFGNGGDWRLGAWLNTILSNVCSDILVRRRPSAPFEEWAEGRADDRPDAVELVSDHLVLQAVADAIASLPASQRSAFLLRMVDDRPYDEVAATLGISEDNARARVARARSALQRSLSRCETLTGVLTAAPLLVVGSLRSALRRVFSSNAGDSAHVTAATTFASNASGATVEAASVTSGTLGSGMQLLTQLASTPVAQTALAASASGGARGSVVLGVVASLAAAGGLSVPAMVVASSTPSAAVQPAPHLTSVTMATAPSTATTGTPSMQAHPAVAAASTTPSQISSAPPAPSWVALAASAAVNGRAAVTSGASTKSTSSGGSTTAPASSTPSTTSTTSGVGGAGAFATGSCTSIPGFPGVTAPTSVPPLSSDSLEGLMSSSPESITSTNGAPGFSTTASLTSLSGMAVRMRIHVGTCLAAESSILAVDMTGATGAEVQLVGSLVSAPTTSVNAAEPVNYLFRGQATQIAGAVLPGGELPWDLAPSFVAEVQQQPGNTASIEVVFLKTLGDTATGTATPAGPSTSSGTPPASKTPSGGTGGASGTSGTASSTGGTTGPAATSAGTTPSGSTSTSTTTSQAAASSS